MNKLNKGRCKKNRSVFFKKKNLLSFEVSFFQSLNALQWFEIISHYEEVK